MLVVLMRSPTGAGVTSAHRVPTRNSSHCMTPGELLAPLSTFCRKLKRSIGRLFAPVVEVMNPEFGSTPPKLFVPGLIQTVAILGFCVKSYLPTRSAVDPNAMGVMEKVMVDPVPPFCTPIKQVEGVFDFTITCNRKLVLSVDVR